MSVMLITYRLQDHLNAYDDLFAEIKKYTHEQVSSTTYLIESTDSPSQIYKNLRPFICTPSDTLLILTMSFPWRGRGPNRLIDWLVQRTK